MWQWFLVNKKSINNFEAPIKDTLLLNRDRKAYKHASNACVNFVLAWVKSVPNFMVFCREREECCNFALLLSFWAFYDYLWRFMVLFGTFMELYDTFWHFWPVTLFWWEFTFVAIYSLFGVKIFWHKLCLFNFFWSFSMSASQIELLTCTFCLDPEFSNHPCGGRVILESLKHFNNKLFVWHMFCVFLLVFVYKITSAF